ncbi:MAG: PH domain-containing protein [Alphaproteobacteria bacterium]
MGRYVQNNLLTGEQVIYEAKVSWAVFILPVIVALFFFAIAFVAGTVFWIIAAVVAVFSFLVAWVKRFATEIAVTNKRVILKTGFVKRDTVEQFLEGIDSISVDQTVTDRLLNAGTIIVRGSGLSFSPVKSIDNPLEFRKQVSQQVDRIRNGGIARA